MFQLSLRNCVYVALVSLGLFCLKRYMRGAVYTGTERLDGKVVLITGANAGIGRETALELAARGAHVVMACRDRDKCSRARDQISAITGNSPVCMKLDLASFSSIRSFAEKFNEKYNRLDVLINNAGIMRTPKLQTTEDGLELQCGVNHFGHFLLTHLVLDKLKAAAPSRIIVVSSTAHKFGSIDLSSIATGSDKYDPSKFYFQSKLANVLFANELSRRLENTGVTVNSLHPGMILTDLWKNIPFIHSVLGRIVFEPVKYFCFITPREGAQTSLRLALDASLEGVTGQYFSDCRQTDPAPVALDQKVARDLWELSETVTRLRQEQ